MPYSSWTLTTLGMSGTPLTYVRPMIHTRVYGDRIVLTAWGRPPCQCGGTTA
jgi:hypothetical protein